MQPRLSLVTLGGTDLGGFLREVAWFLVKVAWNPGFAPLHDGTIRLPD